MKSGFNGNLVHLLLDTQILVWMITGDKRLKRAWQDAIAAPAAELLISAVIAFEFADLQLRGRLPVDETIADLVDRFDLQVAPFPSKAWDVLRSLPSVHRDPVDRMLVAHALLDEAALIAANTNIRRYPVDCI